ncbi:hypothetical protein GCM10028794_28620 [Silanimonas algicola]
MELLVTALEALVRISPEAAAIVLTAFAALAVAYKALAVAAAALTKRSDTDG